MNYGELKAAVQSYLYDRSDLATVIPTFIAMAERKLFRQLRIPANERIVHFTAHEGAIDLPTDFLEAKMLTADGVPLVRITDLSHLNNQDKKPAAGVPREFSRIGAQLHMYPNPDYPVDAALVYWADMSGLLINDADTHEVLRCASDVYLHGALGEASAYLGQDSRIPVWQAKYNEGLMAIAQQAAEAEHAGSVIAIRNAYPDRRG